MKSIQWRYSIGMRLAAGLAATLLAPAASADTPPADATARPIIEVRESAKDGGAVEEGDVIKCQFVIANRGQADLEVARVKPDCGCSVARFEKVIKPGAESVIEAEMHTDYFRGAVTKGFTVFSNDPAKPELRLTLSARVTPLVNVTPGRAAELAVGEKPVTQEFTLVRNGGHPMKIVDVVTNAPYLRAEATSLPGQGRYKVTVTASPDAPPGRNVIPVVVKTDLPKAGMINLILTVDRGIVSVPPVVFYGLITKATTGPSVAMVTVTRRGGPFSIKEVSVDDPKLATKLETVRDGAEYRVTVTYSGGWEPGVVRKTLTVTTDDPKQPELKIPIQAVIQVDPATLPPVIIRAPEAGK